jgi:hypothetical protein
LPGRIQPIWGRGADVAVAGVIELDLRDNKGRQVVENCRRTPAPSETTDYVMLGPGDAITRLFTLTCYEIPRPGQLSMRVRYRNLDPNPPPAPLELLPFFRGPVVSNELRFSL